MFFKNKKPNREFDDVLVVKRFDEAIDRVTSPYGDKEISPQTEKRFVLAHYYKQDYENSLRNFKNIADRKENTENLFNVITSFPAHKDIEGAKTVCDRIISTHRGSGRGKNSFRSRRYRISDTFSYAAAPMSAYSTRRMRK